MRKKVIKVFLVFFGVCIILLNFFIIISHKLDAQVTKWDWVLVEGTNNYYHCEAADEMHCVPKSAHRWENF